jgi:hypothetical protein
MDGIRVDLHKFDAFQSTFKQYVEWNRRDTEMLFLEHARKLATDLYMETAKEAPTKARITADVQRQGWRIPRVFKPGNFGKAWRRGRGVPAQWLGFAMGKMRKGRPTKAALKARAKGMSARPTLKQMQDFVIKIRYDARLYLASGWLGAVSDLGGKLKATSGKVDAQRGGAAIARGATWLRVELWNNTPGIAKISAERGLIERAVRRRLEDTKVHIDRKINEARMRIRA